MSMTNMNNRAPARIAALFAIGLLLTGCGVAGGKSSVATGVKYQDSGQYRAAYIEAKKVLQRDDKNGDAWLLLGKASLMLGNPRDALNELDKARSHGVSEARLAVPTGKALLVGQQFDKVLAMVPSDLHSDAAEQAQAEVLRGDAQRALKQPAAAKQSYEAALKAEPKEADALVGLARLAMDQQDTASASAYVEKALAADPDSPKAWVAKGDLAFGNHDFAGAETSYEKALGIKHADWLPQDDFAARGRLVEVQTEQKQFDKALANIATLEKMAAGQPFPHYLHAVVLYQQGHLDDAVSQLQQVLRAAPDSVPAQILMGAVSYAQGNYGQAEMNLSNVLGVDSKNTAARRLLALTFYREGRSSQALSTLRPMAPDKATDAELLAVLQRAAAAGAGMPPSEQKPGAAQTASGAAPQIASAGTAGGALASAGRALAVGNAAQAIQTLKAMPAGDASSNAQRTTLLVMAYVKNRQVDDAVKTAADYAAKNPKDSSAHLMYGTALVAAGKHAEARAQYNEAVKLDPTNLGALMSLGSLDATEKHFADAAQQYNAVLKQDPKNATAMASLGKLAAIQNNQAEAIKQYRRAIAAQPKSPTAYVELVMLYSRSGQFDDAAKIAKQLAAAVPGNAAALNAYGAAELNAGHHAEALKPLEQAVKLAPQMPLYRVNLARAQVLNKDSKAARGNLEAVIKADPGEVQATSLLAFMKLQDHDAAGAIALAQGLQKQSATATRAAGYALEGDLYMAQKFAGKAAAAYQQGLKVQYDRALVVKTFLALNQSGAKAPESVLKDWLAKHADDAAVRLMLGQYYLGHDRSADAASQYEAVLKAYPTNVDALNNLAWIYTEQKNPKAVSLAEKAHKLAPTSPGVQDTYGWALVQANQAKTALPILAQAAKAAPKVPAIQYHLAVAQARTGDKSGARATLAALRQSGADFQGKQDADKLYAELGGTSAH